MSGSNPYVATSVATSAAKATQCTCGPATNMDALECLVHPRFFCGQLLTDQDLNALLSWTQGKFRLRRQLHGWGIACGLEVSSDPANASGVLISAGYALDDCGNDILLCQGASLSLADACAMAATNCLELPARRIASSKGREVQQGKASARTEELAKGTADTLRVVDVLVRYKPVPSNPLPVLGRSACAERSGCEPSRVTESFELFWRDAEGFTDPQQPALETWESKYFSIGRGVVDKVVEAASRGGGYNYFERFEVIKQLLLEWLERYPPQRLCFLPEAVARLSQKSELLPLELAQVLGWMVVDWRLTYLDQGCSSGDPQLGVPLARVVLQRRTNPKQCSVHYIDTAAPYRRRLQQDHWPAPPAMFNLGQLVWQPLELACAQLRELGQTPYQQQVQFKTPHELRAALDEEWPQGTVRSKLTERKVGLFLDLSCKSAQPSEQRLQVSTIQFNAGAYVGTLPAGNRALSFDWQRAAPSPLPEPRPPHDGDPTEKRPDVLAEIHDIGEERAERLRLEGITTFAQLAAMDLRKIQALFPSIKRDEIKSWQKEAQRRVEAGT